jgi:ABC-type multidrug transport system fused ATPase/permease subunit
VDQLKRLLRYTQPYRGRLWLALLAMIVYAGGTTGIAVLVRPIFDKVLRVEPRDVPKIAFLLLGVFLKGRRA